MISERELELDAARLDEYRTHDAKLQSFKEEIWGKHQSLIDSYKRLQSDYEEERESRERHKQPAKGQERDSFVLVLIDGDGYVFDQVSGTVDGGQNAAQSLDNAVKISLRARGLEHCRIMVRVYANLVGLSRAVAKISLCGAERRSLASFTTGFTHANDLFDFVDAGELKGIADLKIRAMFRQFIDNAQCRHIYFAACHDAVHVSELTPYMHNQDRITLVNNVNFHPEFTKLGLRTEDFHGIFRTSPLEAVITSPQKGSSTEICHFHSRGMCKYGNECRKQHKQSVTIDTNVASDRNQTPPSSQIPALVSSTKIVDDPVNSGSIHRVPDFAALPSLHNIPDGFIAVNRSRYRLDPYIPPPTAEDRASFAACHHAERKLCNNYHLNKFCSNGDTCAFDHSVQPPGVVNCLRQVATKSPCPKQGACRSSICTQGHLCQKTDCRCRGGKAYCRLSTAMHINDITTVEYIAGRKIRNPLIGATGRVDTPDGKGTGPLSALGDEETTHQSNTEDPEPGTGALLSDFPQGSGSSGKVSVDTPSKKEDSTDRNIV